MNRLHTLAAAAALLATSSVALAAGQVRQTTVVHDLAPGASFEVLIGGAGFTDAVLGGGFGLSWDPAVLRLTAVSVDAVVWEFARGPGTVDNNAGKLSDAYFASNRAVLPTGDFAIAKMVFSAVGAGTTTIQSRESALFPWVNEVGDVLEPTYGGLRVTVAAIPEPATWALWAGALALLPLVRRRSADA